MQSKISKNSSSSESRANRAFKARQTSKKYRRILKLTFLTCWLTQNLRLKQFPNIWDLYSSTLQQADSHPHQRVKSQSRLPLAQANAVSTSSLRDSIRSRVLTRPLRRVKVKRSNSRRRSQPPRRPCRLWQTSISTPSGSRRRMCHRRGILRKLRT